MALQLSYLPATTPPLLSTSFVVLCPFCGLGRDGSGSGVGRRLGTWCKCRRSTVASLVQTRAPSTSHSRRTTRVFLSKFFPNTISSEPPRTVSPTSDNFPTSGYPSCCTATPHTIADCSTLLIMCTGLRPTLPGSQSLIPIHSSCLPATALLRDADSPLSPKPQPSDSPQLMGSESV